MTTLTKDPDAKLDYTVNWAPFLTSVSDTAATFTWVVNPATGLVLTDVTNTGTTHSALIAGGALHHTYRVTSRVTTTAGRIQDQSFLLEIAQT